MRTARLRKPAESPRPAGLFSCGKRSSKKPVDFTSQPYFTQAAAGSYQQETQTKLWQLNRLYEYDTPTYFSIMVHELGHAFGLGDEYLEDRPHNYASATPGQGIMSRIYSPISCDELDGMITLLDRFSGKQRSFASFCAPTVVLESGESVPAAEEL